MVKEMIQRMRKQNNKKAYFEQCGSIKEILGMSYKLIAVLIAIPIALLAISFYLMTDSYNSLIANINNANEIITIFEDDMDKELWDIVAGNKSFEQGRQYILLHQAMDKLNRLEGNTSGTERLIYVEAAIRSGENVGQYLDKLGKQIHFNGPVSSNEEILREIRNISGVIQDMLRQYIYVEVTAIFTMNQKIDLISTITIILIILFFAVSAVFTMRAYRAVLKSIGNPIADLKEMSGKLANGDLSIRLEPVGVAELAPLVDSLNKMAEQLENFVETRVLDQKNLRKSEMRTLQAQITPHFIYNTMDTIVWLAEEQKTQEIIDITMALSQFFRISLSKGEDWIPVEMEVRHVKSYLHIQSYRYGNLMSYEIDVAETLLDCKMLKLLLQPLVENSLYHGIKNQRRRGHILVKGVDNRDGTMTFTVIDNGAGMNKEKLNQLRQSLKRGNPTPEIGYGTYNVNKRIHLYYDTGGLKIKSNPENGTEVSFTIPKGGLL